MVLELGLCEDADIHRFFEIVVDGFGTEHEYINVVFPDHETAAGRKIGGERFLAFKKSDPNTTFLKVTDKETGEIIGAAKWNICDGFIPPETGLGTTEYWESEEMAGYAEAMFKLYLEPRRKAIRDSGGHLVSLDILAVDPKHHYRGAGRMLVDWGIKKADDLDVEAVVEGSVYGRHLYEQCGFRNKQFVKMEPPKEFEHLAKQIQRYFWMVRPKKSDTAANS